MSKTSPLFAWRDRDTAARLMLQLSQIAPPYVRRRALEILPAFKSSVLIDEMVEIIVDEDRDLLERRAALETLTAVPSGDLYFPQFAAFALDGWNDLTPSNFLRFSVAHPRNVDWVFDIAQKLWNRESYLHWLSDIVHWWRDHPTMLKRVEPDIEAVLQAYPNTKEAIENLTKARIRQDHPVVSTEELAKIYSEHPIRAKLYEKYLSALKGDFDSYYELYDVVEDSAELVSKRAAALHLLGLLQDDRGTVTIIVAENPHHFWLGPLFARILRNPPSIEAEVEEMNQYQIFNKHLFFEAGENMLRTHKSRGWELLVDIFFTNTQREIDYYLRKWIGELTDALSAQPIGK